ncbi:egg shell protein [Fusarium austroafricanum]|uniref:Egg shell protein n=1 Tax=Fusarium austroafricanum TaxID=2364996 RepID=A0A8H4KU53_9HYPO|nr:egg shell protein [Fusarium austroafricanum]
MGSNQWYSNGWYDASSPQDQASSPFEYSFDYYQSQPLVRYESSGGSSQASTIPESPTQSHYYTLRGSPTMNHSSYQQHYTSSQTRAGESSAPRSESGNDWPVSCLHPGCTARPFKRTADLVRHYKNTHAPESSKDVYLCDYPRCTRFREPFHRRDHFRDHLREYHREDIQKRGATVNEEWLEGRYAPSTWWRCPRCLVRVYISKNGYECPGCKTSCESKRKEKRRSRS